MAKVTVAGNAVVITSSLPYETIKTIKKYRPEALYLYGGEDGKEPVFAISVGSASSVEDFGITFSGKARGEEGLAQLTMSIDHEVVDVKEFLADEIGSAITNLNTLEGKLAGVLDAINAEREAIKDGITIVE